MKRTYYVIEANDGCQVSKELGTIKEARAELKSIIREDMDEFGLEEGCIDYYIAKYIESGNTISEEVVKWRAQRASFIFW